MSLSATERWSRLDSKRRAVLERARDCSALTIPALVPPDGHTDNDTLPTPYQSLGARGVNNLASKLLLTLLPPGTAFFRLRMSEKTKDEAKAGGINATEIEKALAKVETIVSGEVDTGNTRPTLFELLKHLVVAGNGLMHMPESGLRMYRLDQYACARSPDGTPLETVLKQQVSPVTLDESVAAACKVDTTKKDTLVDVYTVILRDAKTETSWQEINNIEVPESRSELPVEKAEWHPLRWTAVPNQDYGRGLCEEYLGDLRSLEGLSEALVQFSAAASKIINLVRPGAVTKVKDLNKAESGDYVTGVPEDIKVHQVEKYGDFQVTKATADEITLRLSHAFLLRSGTTRDAERVTAEEIRQMAQELEDVLGGVYTVLATELQLPIVKRLLSIVQRRGDVQALPRGTVRPVIVTGFEALGRNHSVNKLRAWIADVAAVDPTLSTIKKDVVTRRLGVGYGVEDLDDLIKTAEEIAAETQAQQQADLLQKAAGPAAGAIAKSALG
jgi:hypothetical protein